MRQDEVVSSDVAPPPVVDDAAAEPAARSAIALDTSGGNGHEAPPTELAGGPATADPVELDPGMIDLARAAAVAQAGTADHVGDFGTAVAEDDIAVTASFVARQPGYGGWHWSVTLAVLEGSATVSEVVLLPGEGALLAPAWVPWDQRIRPGDVGVGDLLPPIDDDPRLVPAYLQSDDPAVEAVAHELGIGRVHVLSREGRVDFAERLHDGTFGPTGEIALAAPAACFSCAFYLPLAGSLGQLVGACGNEYSPADGRVVDAEFGCGAHSETVIEMPARSAATLAVIDELSLEVHRHPAPIDNSAQVEADAVDDVDAEAVDEVDDGQGAIEPAIVTMEVDVDGEPAVDVDESDLPEVDSPAVDSPAVGSPAVDGPADSSPVGDDGDAATED